MTLVVMQVKWSVTLTDRLGPEILTVLERKGQVLHRVLLHLKVPGWSLSLNALLTKKLPKFLSRLNEMSGGRENLVVVVKTFLVIGAHSSLTTNEHLRDAEQNNTDASKPVARHFNLPNHSHHNMTICGLSLHHGNTESCKNLEQKFIFQLGTLSPHGINERLSFH